MLPGERSARGVGDLIVRQARSAAFLREYGRRLAGPEAERLGIGQCIAGQTVGTMDVARGLAGGSPRIGFLLSPPYFPLRVGGG